jgi:TonB-linked SusC/RagA family outer membrane protein
MRKSLLALVGALLLLFQTAVAQTIEVSGRITDENGQPLTGASVQEKGTRKGTLTDASGSFRLSVGRGATLEITSVGYNKKEVVANTAAIQVSLAAASGSLSEIVVTGVGVATSKKRIAISVESVTTDKTTPVPTASVDQFLVGKVAGAQISSTNGNPGAPTNILLRGINTLNRGTTPMILLDGVEVRATELNSIDLNNIERMEIVQGAASATIYGAQGANGVIQLFSKKGRQGKINIDFSSGITTSELLNVGGVSKAKLHSFKTNANNEVVGSNNQPIQFDPVTGSYQSNVIVNLIDPTSIGNKPYDRNFKYYDHYDLFFQQAQTYNNSIAVSGGRERVDFNLTASDNRQTSNFKDNGHYARSNFGANVGIELFKNFRFRSITQLAYTRNKLLDPDGRTYMYALNNARPFADFEFKDAKGLYSAYFGDAVGVNHYNPLYARQFADFTSNKIDVIQNFNANYRFAKYLELDAKYGLNYQTQDDKNQIFDQTASENAEYWQYWAEYYYPTSGTRVSYGAPNAGSESGEINRQRYQTLFQNFIGTAIIRTDFKNDFKINIPLRTTTQVAFDYRSSKFNRYITYGLDAPSYTPYTASQMATYKIQDDYVEPFITYGYLINQRFEWGDLAGISGGIRRDWSSAFGSGQRPATFPRGDAYLNISSLGFWSNGRIRNTINGFKLRAAYGEAGIQPRAFDRYVVLSTRNMGNNVGFTFPTANPNANLEVEVSKELEAGTDLSFNVLKGRWLQNASLSFTYWDRKSEGVIYDVDAAPSTGTGTVRDNAFGLASQGIQASLNLGILQSRNITWNLTTLFSKQESKIASIKGPEIVVTSAAGSSNYVLRAGEKIGQLYGWVLLKDVDQRGPDGSPFIPKADQVNYEVASNGWVVNKTTKQPFATPDRYSLGDPNPKFNMSFINDFNFKGFLSFNMQWDWLHGNNLYNQTKGWMYRDGIHSDFDKAINIAGQSAQYTAFYRGVYAARSNNGTKNYFMEDASFVRLRNISLAFDVAKFTKLPYFQRLQLVLSGRNLVTFTDYTGFDPEVSSGTNNSAFDRGVDHNTIPNLKSYQIALNIGF